MYVSAVRKGVRLLGFNNKGCEAARCNKEGCKATCVQ